MGRLVQLVPGGYCSPISSRSRFPKLPGKKVAFPIS